MLSSKNLNFGGESPTNESSNNEANLISVSEEKMINNLFPEILEMPAPTAGEELTKWNDDINRDKGFLQARRNWQCLQRTIAQTKLSLEPNLQSLECFKKQPITPSAMEKILTLACSSILVTNYYSGKIESGTVSAVVDDNDFLVLTGAAITQAANLYQKVSQGSIKLDSQLKNIVTSNEFEKKLLESCVIPTSQLNVQFKDIGSHDKVKKTMEELIMLPLRRPELFKRGQLIHSTRGILLCK